VHTLEIRGRELELFLTKHTLAAAAATFTAAALAFVWCGYYCCCCCWVRTSPTVASTDTELVIEPH